MNTWQRSTFDTFWMTIIHANFILKADLKRNRSNSHSTHQAFDYEYPAFTQRNSLH